jgi:hypothetical protein
VTAFLHGEFGWQGFAFAALAAFALVIIFNELAKAALTKSHKHKKRGRRSKTSRKTRQIEDRGTLP